jgi:hypothetical protein
MRYLLILLACLSFAGCPGRIPTVDTSGLGSATAASIERDDDIASLKKRLVDAVKERDAAVAKGNKLGSLEAERDVAKNEAALYRQKANERDDYVKLLDKQIRQEKEREIQTKLYWATGIIGGLSIIAIGLGLWLSITRLTAAGVIGLGLGAACWTLAWLVPYMLWIGTGVLVIGVGTLLVMLYRRHNALKEVAGVIEAGKQNGQIVIDDYKAKLGDAMSWSSDAILDNIRKKLRKP